ncbi:uncharacterized protein [Watersipora subatra]|uniref:uncharacterized protein n=1 Tax=Watersipora subatra TaxID=2589382 RepID=UPI00355B508C
MAGAGDIKEPSYSLEDKGKDFKIFLEVMELKTKFMSSKPVDGTKVEHKFTEKIVQVRVSIGNLTYKFNLQLPEAIDVSQSKLLIIGDRKIELWLRKKAQRSWESYIPTLYPSVKDFFSM